MREVSQAFEKNVSFARFVCSVSLSGDSISPFFMMFFDYYKCGLANIRLYNCLQGLISLRWAKDTRTVLLLVFHQVCSCFEL
jgi:hypothetical protein